MEKAKVFQRIMLVVLIIVGILQFFELPKVIDYVLGIVALGFGIAGYIHMMKS